MRHIALGGVQHFGKHIVALGKCYFYAGESLLHTDFFFIEVIERSNAPEDNGHDYNQNNNYRSHNK